MHEDQSYTPETERRGAKDGCLEASHSTVAGCSRAKITTRVGNAGFGIVDSEVEQWVRHSGFRIGKTSKRRTISWLKSLQRNVDE